uniref:Uncharacterized protein n=1 Tax=viral metagenome TaxID=1070528 RepID=A0A6M3IPK4_9ZZZZ
MHEHNDCEHDLNFCKKCNVVYCNKCEKEWIDPVPDRLYPPNYTVNEPYKITYEAACTH